MNSGCSVRNHVNRHSRSAHDNDSFDRWRFFQTFVDSLLKQDFFSTTPTAVSGDDQLGLGVVIPVSDGIGTESTENNRMGRANSGTGEHRDRQFGDHRHIQRDAIPGGDPQLFQHVCKFTNFAMQVLIGQNATVSRFPFPDDGRLVLTPCEQVAVDAIVTGVDLSADEPLGFGHVPLNHMVPLFEPVKVAGQFAPERGRIVLGLIPHLLILGFRADVRLFREFCRGRKRSSLLQCTLNIFARHQDRLRIERGNKNEIVSNQVRSRIKHGLRDKFHATSNHGYSKSDETPESPHRQGDPRMS